MAIQEVNADVRVAGGRDRREAALALVRDGVFEPATDLLKAELASGDGGARWLTDEIVRAMQADDLRFAGDLARISASLRYGPRPATTVAATEADESPSADDRRLSADKLRHDIDQFRYLQSIGVLGTEVDGVVRGYEEAITGLERGGPEARRPVSPDDSAAIRETYARLGHVRDTPRIAQALSAAWDPAEVEDRYLHNRPGLVVIDDFLHPDALAGLQAFCLESTVWNGNRYPYGRLGAFFDSGFNCPLVLQVAEELRARFPRMIGQRHTLRQLWAFKYPPNLPPDSTIHADFAAVNVNFWITPDRANRDASTGGLIVYDVDAPPDWDFVSYNERLDLIKEFLRRSGAKAIYVPYRENRAIVFNSDLFHATAEVDFGSAYTDRRINITMLYGVREHDDLHPTRASAPTNGDSAPSVTPSWRSAAFSRTRRR